MLLDDTGDGSARKEGGRHVKIVVNFQDEMKWKEVSSVSSPALKCKWSWNVRGDSSLQGTFRNFLRQTVHRCVNSDGESTWLPPASLGLLRGTKMPEGPILWKNLTNPNWEIYTISS